MAKKLQIIEPIKESITISIPAFNEEGTLEEVVMEALEVVRLATSSSYEVLIVDDGSNDCTGNIARRLADEIETIRVYTHPHNLGFHAAQHSCYTHALCDWVFLLPADGQVTPWVLSDFLPLCVRADLILGTHDLRSGSRRQRFLSHTYHTLVDLLFHLKLKEFGSCLLLRRRLYINLEIKSKTPVAMTELVLKAQKTGARVEEVKVRTMPRLKGYSKTGGLYWRIPRIMYDIGRLYWEINNLT